MKSVRWFSASSVLHITVRPLASARRRYHRWRFDRRTRIYTAELARRTDGTIHPDSIVWRLLGGTWKPLDFIRSAGYLIMEAGRSDDELSRPDLIDLGNLLVHLADKIEDEGL